MAMVCGYLGIGWTVSSKCEHVHILLCTKVDQLRKFTDIRTGYSGHDRTVHSCIFDTVDLCKSRIKRTGFAEHIVRFSHSVKGKLILHTTVFVKLLTDLVIQMKRVAENCPADIFFFQQLRQFPKVLVQDRIAACDVKVWRSADFFAHFFTGGNDLPHLFPRHFRQLFAVIFCKDIAVFAALVAGICDVPLKSKIWFHKVVPS